MIGVDDLLDNVSGFEESGLQLVEIEVVRLLEPLELELPLGGKDRRRAAAEAAVVDASDGRVMVGELREDIGGSDEGLREYRGMRLQSGFLAKVGLWVRGRIAVRAVGIGLGLGM